VRPQRANTSAALNRGQPPAVELPAFNTPPPVRRAEAAADSSDEDSSDVCHKTHFTSFSSWDVLCALSLLFSVLHTSTTFIHNLILFLHPPPMCAVLRGGDGCLGD